MASPPKARDPGAHPAREILLVFAAFFGCQQLSTHSFT
jgi:hypothetical protein